MDPTEESNVIEISSEGDLVLEIYSADKKERFLYRVQSDRLREASAYFTQLLQPGKFGEGAAIHEQTQELAKKYGKLIDAPAIELPRAILVDVGRISKVSTIKLVAADFLRTLHGLDLTTTAPPIPNLANLTVLADRFDALPYFAGYMKRRKYLMAHEIKRRGKDSSTVPEETLRRMLMIGILLDFSPWVSGLSKALVVRGSTQWPQPSDVETAALWWDLPTRIEDELAYRRQCILETLESVQIHFLDQYVSGGRQCKLGYDSSTQCDSFQLGEMVRFFTRIKTLRLQGILSDHDQAEPGVEGNIETIMDTLRQCSSYQINQYHSHCGLRTRLIPVLDLIQKFIGLNATNVEVGICSDCWKSRRREYAWMEAKRPLTWSRSGPQTQYELMSLGQQDCFSKHVRARDMFTAVQRYWE